MRYTLMMQEREVLDFEINPGTESVGGIWPRDGYAWAPLELPTDDRDQTIPLTRFLRRRAISRSRIDLPQILKATGAASAVDLALRSGGFSLSDPYWYRAPDSRLTWEGVNFFDNDWDDAFGKAILKRDYDALARTSTRTPDVTLGGFSRKAWLQTASGPRLLKATPDEDDASIYCEALVSRMLDRLVGVEGHLAYEPATFGGEVFSSSGTMVGADEELVSGNQLLAHAGVSLDGLDARTGTEGFSDYTGLYLRVLGDMGIVGGRAAMAKLFVLATLTLDFDTHGTNFGFIRDVRSGELRPAPLFDHGRGFLFMRDRYQTVLREPAIADLLLALYFSRLDPTWDYSWYEPVSLVGFEDEIVGTLSSIGSLPTGYPELMATLFCKQRAYVERVATSSHP